MKKKKMMLLKRFLLLISLSIQCIATEIIPITSKFQFDDYMASNLPVVVIVSSSGCLPCQALKEWVRLERFHGIQFLAVSSRQAEQFGLGPIGGVPQIFGYKKSELAFRQIGFGTRNSGKLRKKIMALL